MKKRYLAAGIGAVLALVLLTLLIFIFPLVQAAILLHDVSEFQGFEYEMSMELKEENLSESQKKWFSSLAWALGDEENSGMSFQIAGRVSDSLAYGQVYYEGYEEPVTELFFRQGEGRINVKMLYDSIRENLIVQHPLLGAGLWEWEYGEYLSSSQIEEIFQVDFAELFQAEELTGNHNRSFWESFRMLLGMESKKGADGGRQFETELGEYHVLLEIKREGEYPSINLTAFDRTGSREAASFAGAFTFQETEEIIFPDSLMDDKDIQQFANLWSVVDGLQNIFPER